MRYRHNNFGTCSSAVEFDLNNGVVTNVEFFGGCNGNLKAISKLVNGMRADEIVRKLLGNSCGAKQTSCADQLAKAIMLAVAKEQGQV